MGRIYAKLNNKIHYVVGINEETDTVTYTESKSSGTDYGGEYYTKAQLEYLRNYFSEKQPELKCADIEW